MKAQRITALSLAILMSLLASCGSNSDQGETTTAADVTPSRLLPDRQKYPMTCPM